MDKEATDPQDPLPEASWTWRRAFTYVLTAAILWMIWGAITRLGVAAAADPSLGIPALLSLCRYLLLVLVLVTTYYMLAPSAEQMVKLMQTAGMLKHGVQIVEKSKTTATEKTESMATGKPPLPVSDITPEMT